MTFQRIKPDFKQKNEGMFVKPMDFARKEQSYPFTVRGTLQECPLILG